MVVAGFGVARYVLVRHRGRGVPVRISIPDDTDAAAVTRALWAARVIDTPWLFHGLAWVTGAAAGARPGLMVLRDDLTPREILRALANGQAGLVRVTIPEGFNRFDIARRLTSAGAITNPQAFLDATTRADVLERHGLHGMSSMEGRLFPDTYDLPVNGSPELVIDRMARTFQRRWDALIAAHPAGLERATELAGAESAVQAVLVLASIVQRETGSPEDLPHVASVFWNRLTLADFHPRLLQSDPTVTYGCLVAPSSACEAAGWSEAAFPQGADAGAGEGPHGAITAAMLADDANPYNTYRHEGLPPGPVCNPGAAALAAVLEPSITRDVYFVARGEGRSAFAATLDEHNRNVARYLHRTPRDAAP